MTGHYEPDLDIAQPAPRVQSEDVLYVLLDSIGIMNSKIRDDETFRPWEDQRCDGIYATETKAGYEATLAAAETIIEAMLSGEVTSFSKRMFLPDGFVLRTC